VRAPPASSVIWTGWGSANFGRGCLQHIASGSETREGVASIDGSRGCFDLAGWTAKRDPCAWNDGARVGRLPGREEEAVCAHNGDAARTNRSRRIGLKTTMVLCALHAAIFRRPGRGPAAVDTWGAPKNRSLIAAHDFALEFGRTPVYQVHRAGRQNPPPVISRARRRRPWRSQRRPENPARRNSLRNRNCKLRWDSTNSSPIAAPVAAAGGVHEFLHAVVFTHDVPRAPARWYRGATVVANIAMSTSRRLLTSGLARARIASTAAAHCSVRSR